MRLFDLAREQARRRPDLTAFILLVPILLMAAALRGSHRADWDSFLPLIHPDEYHVADRVTTMLRVPDSFAAYLRSACPTAPDADQKPALVAPQNPKEPLAEQYPSAASGCNSLNPRNLPWARTHVYGSFPTSLVRVAAELRYGDENLDRNEVVELGRRFSTWADLLIIVLLFLIGRRLAGRRVGLLGALLYAWTPFAIQQAHFFTVDTQAAAYGMLALWFCLGLAEGGGSRAALGAGVGLGLATASKINMAALALIVVLAALQAGWRRTLPFDEDNWHPLELLDRLWRAALAALGWMLLAGAATLITVRFAMPDAFVGESLLDIRLEERFLAALRNARETASGAVDFPPSHQFANRAPWLYDWINMVRWGMGVPLGLAAWGGWAALGIGLLRGNHGRWLTLWAWVGFYFWWQGGQPIKPMRYHLPIYGLLALFGAWALVRLIDLGRAADRPPLFRRALPRGLPGRIAAGLALATTAATVLWGWGFSQIYERQHPRAAAAAWARRSIPPGSRISSEAWDVGIYNLESSIWPNRNTELKPADEDSPEKIAALIATLDSVEYVALTSNRAYGSLPQLPLRFPATLNYYRALFDGSLGFEQAADFTSFPSFLGIPINDERADESWSVYDHPRVTIFRKTGAWSPERANELLTAGVNFEETYRLKPIDISPAPSALQLSAGQWEAVRAGGSWAETLAGAANRLPLLAWLLAVEILGLAAWGWLWRWRLPLPDRGLGLARIAGLLAFAWLAWLPAGLGLLGFDRWWLGLVFAGLAASGLWQLWRERAALGGWLRERRRALIAGQLIYLGGWGLLLLARLLNPDLWHPLAGGETPISLAQWTATLKSEVFPPYDPWFAGGYQAQPYWGYVLFGAPCKLLGLDPGSGFNLALPAIAGLTAQLAGSLGYNLHAGPGRARAGLERRALRTAILAAAAVTLAGNLGQVALYANGLRALGNPALSLANPTQSQENLWLRGGAAPIDLARGLARLAGGGQLPLRPEWRYATAARIEPNTSLEFPLLAFLRGDLAGHAMALPAALLALALLLALWRARSARQRLALTVAAGFALGAAAAIHGASTAPYRWLGVATVAVAALQTTAGAEWRRRWPALGGALLALLAAQGLPWLPATRWLAPEAAAAFAPAATYLSPRALIAGYAPALWIVAGAGILLARRLWSRAAQIGAVAGITLWMAAASMLSLAVAGRPDPADSPNPLANLFINLVMRPFFANAAEAILLLPLAAAGLALLASLLGRTAKPRLLFPAAWAVGGLLALLLSGTEASHQGGRLSIVFTGAFAAWVLLALAAAALLPLVRDRLRRPERRFTAGSLSWRIIAGMLAAGALLYPLTALPAKIGDRAVPDAPRALDGMGGMEAGDLEARAEARAIRWLRANVAGTPIILEAAGPSYGPAGRISAWTGLPTLIGWDEHEQQLRAATQPNQIISHRRELAGQLYAGTNPLTASQLLDRYGVQLIYVGPQERAQYGGDGGAAGFDRLAAEDGWSVLYAQDGVRIYGRAGVAPIPAALPKAWSLGVPPPDPLRKITLPELLKPAAPAEQVGDWPWLARHPLAAAGLWWLLFAALGLLAWPISALALRSHAAGAWALSRTVGWLLLGWLVWFPASLGLWDYSRASVLLGIGLLGGISLAALRLGGGARIRAAWRHQRRALLVTELVLLAAFAGLTLLRAANPDLWHPYWGGEKPFESGMLIAVLRSPSFPPPDPLWSGGSINYYYYGLFLCGLPMKLLGLAPATGFQLAVATVGMLAAGGAWGAALLLSRRLRTAALALAAVIVIGNLGSVLAVGQSTGLLGIVRGAQNCGGTPGVERPACAPLAELAAGADGRPAFAAALGALAAQIADAADHGALSGLSTRLGEGTPWFWGPSRVADTAELAAINEFPAWSLLFADLHPHLIALPITLLMIALGLELSRRRPWAAAWPGLALAAWGFGALIAANAWDAPAAALLVLGGLGLRAWHGERRRGAVAGGLALGGLALAAGVALYAPFLGGYQAPVGGLWPVRVGSGLGPWLTIHAGFGLLILGGALLAGRRPGPARRRPRWMVGAAIGGLLLAALLWDWAGRGRLAPIIAASLPIRLLLMGLLALLIGRVLGWRRATPGVRGALALAALGCAMALGVELVFVRDHLAPALWEQGPGQGERMNTIFKFGFQVWVLWGLAAALLLPHLLRRPKGRQTVAGRLARGAAGGAIGLLAAAGLIFPLAGALSRAGMRFPAPPAGLTLDGLAFMETASYAANDAEIPLAADRRAIDWLQANLRGAPTVLQSEQETYRAYGARIAANTGLPTVIGALHASEQRPGALAEARIRDVQRIYGDAEPAEARWLINKYAVDYVYVGPLERARDPRGVAKFAAMQGLEPVYNQDGVTIYQVTPQLKALALTWRDPGLPSPEPAPPAQGGPELEEARARYERNPGDPGLAFSYGRLLEDRGEYGQAAAMLRQATADHPGDAALHHLLGDVLLAAGDFAGGVGAYQAAYQIAPTPENLGKVGEGYLEWGAIDPDQLAPAERTLRDALAAKPELADLHYLLGETYRLLGNIELARGEYQAYLAQAPADALWVGPARQQLNDLER